ncbi:hypothetical protein JI435_402240 [Parastagonospora nodorum SN15]|uniref:Uncharacterized protein n=1 Tax=Phaeosphaeria nodorum (strain SN15 / ATCC MYA-4574 / FGSC 10173) TaxID=321614 RepID=A0A7U2ESP9_PHANO|nr:hypothetical protein JI435_402240 [Parastagonospora nodorum SN15]
MTYTVRLAKLSGRSMILGRNNFFHAPARAICLPRASSSRLWVKPRLMSLL